jgi:hypothetical protein
MTILDILLVNYVWSVILIWTIVYISDYYLTLLGARLYATSAKETFLFEGSYEITPAFQDDVNSLRLFSPTFFRYVLASIGAILLVWLIDVRLLKDHHLYVLLLGGLFLREAALIVRHFRNISLFYLSGRATDIRGQIQYPRWLTLQVSATELTAFGFLFLILFIPDNSWFFIGGAAGCFVTAFQHYTLSSKAQLKDKPPPSDENPSSI